MLRTVSCFGALTLTLLLTSCGDDRPLGIQPSGAGGSAGGGSGGNSGSGAGGSGAPGGASAGTAGEGGMGADGGTSGSGGSSGAGSGGSAAGSGGSGAGAAGSSGSGGGAAGPLVPCPSDDSTDSPPSLTSQCEASAPWDLEGATLTDIAEVNRVVTVTPDELSLIWYTAGGGLRSSFLAEREATTEAFGTPEEFQGFNLIALSPDGLRLTGFSSVADGLMVSTRAARSESFGDFSEDLFADFNSEAGMGAIEIRAAVLSHDELSLFYSARDVFSDRYDLYLSTRGQINDAWALGELVELCEFTSYGTLAQFPTGISEDALTLFYYDATRRQARAAWRADVDSAFSWFRDLGVTEGVAPNGACDRLYFANADGSIAVAE